jgi:hypothetical protein
LAIPADKGGNRHSTSPDYAEHAGNGARIYVEDRVGIDIRIDVRRAFRDHLSCVGAEAHQFV